mgnify:CR=1 FL=1
MTWQTAKQAALQVTGRTPAWCDVADDNGYLPAAPSVEAMDDCIALDGNGNLTAITGWHMDEPVGENIIAVCYF